MRTEDGDDALEGGSAMDEKRRTMMMMYDCVVSAN